MRKHSHESLQLRVAVDQQGRGVEARGSSMRDEHARTILDTQTLVKSFCKAPFDDGEDADFSQNSDDCVGTNQQLHLLLTNLR